MTASAAHVTFDTILRKSDQVLFQQVSGEAVLLDLASETYFGLNPVGTRIWQLIGDGRPLRAVRDELVTEYGAPVERIETDLLALVTQLLDSGLVAVD